MARIAEHLRPEYFYRWVMNPARILPGTKMPQTIPRNGQVQLAAFRNLPPGEPLNSLWSYLSEGSRAEPPQLEQTVLQSPEPGHPLVQRGETHSDAGKIPTRGISLGFADGTLLFDADSLGSLAVWHGGFVRANAQNYFGIWWSRDGGAAEAIAPEFARLSFRQATGGNWKLPPTPMESDPNSGSRLDGYRIGANSIQLRYRLLVDDRQVKVTEIVRVASVPQWNGFTREFSIEGLLTGGAKPRSRCRPRIATNAGPSRRICRQAWSTIALVRRKLLRRRPPLARWRAFLDLQQSAFTSGDFPIRRHSLGRKGSKPASRR